LYGNPTFSNNGNSDERSIIHFNSGSFQKSKLARTLYQTLYKSEERNKSGYLSLPIVGDSELREHQKTALETRRGGLVGSR
jgi:hypothetical protein